MIMVIINKRSQFSWSREIECIFLILYKDSFTYVQCSSVILYIAFWKEACGNTESINGNQWNFSLGQGTFHQSHCRIC